MCKKSSAVKISTFLAVAVVLALVLAFDSNESTQDSLAWLRNRMPRTHFTSATVDPKFPGLLRVQVEGQPSPLYFDPRHHLLVIGLVVNLDDKGAVIAPGRLQ